MLGGCEGRQGAAEGRVPSPAAAQPRCWHGQGISGTLCPSLCRAGGSPQAPVALGGWGGGAVGRAPDPPAVGGEASRAPTPPPPVAPRRGRTRRKPGASADRAQRFPRHRARRGMGWGGEGAVCGRPAGRGRAAASRRACALRRGPALQLPAAPALRRAGVTSSGRRGGTRALGPGPIQVGAGAGTGSRGRGRSFDPLGGGGARGPAPVGEGPEGIGVGPCSGGPGAERGGGGPGPVGAGGAVPVSRPRSHGPSLRRPP